MKIVFCFSVIFFFIPTISEAQAPAWIWANAGQDVGDGLGYDIATDGSGNVYVTGFFRNSVAFGSTVLTSFGDLDGYLVKYDPSGAVVWARQMGGAGSDQGNALAVDADGHIYVAGSFQGTVNFGATTLTSAGANDVFLAKYDGAGTLIWAKRGGGAYNENAYEMSLDIFGNIYITGNFTTSATFGTSNLTSYGDHDVYIVKYDTGGSVKWAKGAGCVFDDFSFGVGNDSLGNVYISGQFNVNSTMHFDAIQINDNSSGFVVGCMFLAKYDSSGNAIWAKAAGGINSSSTGAEIDGAKLAVEPDGNVYLTGTYHECKMNFGAYVLNGIGDADVYIAKYNTLGSFVWAKSIGWYSFDYAGGIALDSQANVFITGSFNQFGIFGSDTLTGSGAPDIFVAKYDKNGNEKWAAKAGGTGNDKGLSIACNNADAYVTGWFSDATATFGNHSVANGGGMDMFVAKLIYPDVGVQQTNPVPVIFIYPNPATNQLTIKGKLDNFYEATIYDMMGRQVVQYAVKQYVAGNKMAIDVGQLANGVYQLRLSGKDGVQVKTIVIEK